MADNFSHVGEDGSVRMVDVSAKPVSKRMATAEAMIALRPETIAKIDSNRVAKRNVLATARIAAIQEANRLRDL